MMTRLDASRDESGAVAIVMALSLMLFVGMLAITTDLGLLRDEKAHAQASADNAVLAAAYSSCVLKQDMATARAAAADVAKRNGYQHGVDGVSVVITQDSTSPNRWTAVIGTGIDGVFSPATTGQTELPTGARARAECEPANTIVTPGNQLPAIYAHGTCADPWKALTHSGNFSVITGDLQSDQDFLWNGNDSTVDGRVHAQRDLQVPGSRNAVTKAVTFGNTYNVTGTANTWPSIAKDSRPPMDWPKTWALVDFQPGGAAALAAGAQYVDMGENKLESYMNPSTKVIPSGLYYSTADKVEIPDGAVSATGGVTIVSTKQFVVKKDANLQPFYQDLLLAAYGTAGTTNCDYKGVDVGGDNNKLRGIIYAPHSQLSYQGNNNESVGSWIARAFYISGTGNKVTSLPAPPTTTTTDPTVKLLK
jgi:hypothetical protein